MLRGKNWIKAMVNGKPVSNQIKSQSLYLFLLFFLSLVSNVQLNRKWEFYASIDWILMRTDFVLRYSIKLYIMRHVPVCVFFSFYTYSWYDNWKEPKIEAGNLFFNLIVYFLFHLNRSLSKKRIYFVGVKCLPIRKNVCSLFVQRFSICSFVHFFRQCYWHYSWIIYWTEGSLFICTPHIQSGPISNFTLSFLVFLLSSQREKAKQSEKKKDNVIQIVFHFFLSFLILCSRKEICILPTIPLFILTG